MSFDGVRTQSINVNLPIQTVFFCMRHVFHCFVCWQAAEPFVPFGSGAGTVIELHFSVLNSLVIRVAFFISDEMPFVFRVNARLMVEMPRKIVVVSGLGLHYI